MEIEKVNFKNFRGLNLIGEFHKTKGKSLILLVHGLTGDRHEWGRFDAMAEALNKVDYNVFAFDFSGCGESDDDSITVEKEIDDLKSAIAFVREREYNLIGLLGLSLGGLLCAKVWNEKIKAMVFWAPATNSKDMTKNFTAEQMKELKTKGFTTKTRAKGVRRKFILSEQLVRERKSTNQKEVLSKIKCPVLIIHGSDDKSVPPEDSKSAMKYLPASSKLEIVKGADHLFSKQVDRFVELSVGWFEKCLKK